MNLLRKVKITVFAVLCGLNVSAQEFTAEIKPLTGEKWYGAYTAKAYCNTPFDQIHFHPFDENTEINDLRVDNKGNQAAPVLLSSKGRYIWSDEPFAFEFKNANLKLYSEVEEIRVVQIGKDLKDAYVGAMKKHFPPSGKTPNELMFRMPQYNTWIELGTNQNQQDIIKYADDVIKNGFPTGVFMIDDIWSNYYGSFEFEATKFPDPKGMMDYLHKKGFKVMLWLTPFISPDSPEFRELARKKCLVLQKDSKRPALIKWWNGYSACLDLSNPEAMEWLRGKLEKLQEKYGIDGFKFDAADGDFYTEGSRVFPNENTNTSGTIQAEMYGRLGINFDFNEFRACWKNGNQPLAQRLQDKGYSWDEMKLLIPDIVSAGLIGHPFTCPDMIGGGLRSNFENIDYSKFDQALMIRSAQIQALMPMMQFSVAPWRVLDENHLRVCREAALLHAKMGDYIVESAKKAAINGEPIVRHMEYEFPNEGFESCNDQYMLGEKYLVAPMVEKGTSRAVRLPKGNWVDDQGKIHKGGKTISIEVPLSRLPYFMYL